MINYIFSMHLQLSNGKKLSLQQETRPYVSGFPLGCCDHSSLMERDLYYLDRSVLHLYELFVWERCGFKCNPKNGILLKILTDGEG